METPETPERSGERRTASRVDTSIVVEKGLRCRLHRALKGKIPAGTMPDDLIVVFALCFTEVCKQDGVPCAVRVDFSWSATDSVDLVKFISEAKQRVLPGGRRQNVELTKCGMSEILKTISATQKLQRTPLSSESKESGFGNDLRTIIISAE